MGKEGWYCYRSDFSLEKVLHLVLERVKDEYSSILNKKDEYSSEYTSIPSSSDKYAFCVT
jgi:hypothetical protein